ncbi:hypothetical protein [Vibrio alginolyticus]|uniref:hypothetical protein n=1 Tax=Vibrio alginolyticus TaxID=663 RepID=UPI0006CA9593|nr:hypothetical protein [Vibrio alginolyticus]KPM98468.1 hypothetical protein AOG25_08465 [Vibrio alginolyticus]CAH7233132.1 conserved hypothetical protein [Vibrio chagasii]
MNFLKPLKTIFSIRRLVGFTLTIAFLILSSNSINLEQSNRINTIYGTVVTLDKSKVDETKYVELLKQIDLATETAPEPTLNVLKFEEHRVQVQNHIKSVNNLVLMSADLRTTIPNDDFSSKVLQPILSTEGSSFVEESMGDLKLAQTLYLVGLIIYIGLPVLGSVIQLLAQLFGANKSEDGNLEEESEEEADERKTVFSIEFKKGTED